jgi:hypothetical protein
VNLAQFRSMYQPTFLQAETLMPLNLKSKLDSDSLSILSEVSGKTFNNGIYRVYKYTDMDRWTDRVSAFFLAMRGNCLAFGCDWLGRQFVLAWSEKKNGLPTVVCLEPGVPDSFCTDLSLREFHAEALVTKAESALAVEFYKKWRQMCSVDILPNQCVGYRVPLFLGGKDEIENLELTDMEVYFELCRQLWEAVKNLPTGAAVNDITFDILDAYREQRDA